MKFCDKLAKARKQNNLSQEQLADRLGMSRQAISKWESGNSYPDMKTMMEICKILNCKLEDLMDDGVIGTVESKTTKISVNNIIKDLLDFITKTYNMLASMRFINKVGCIIEVLIMILLSYIAFSLIGNLLSNLFYPLFNLLPELVYNFIYGILEIVYSILAISLSFVIIVHLFKIRYLDYYVTITDSVVKEKTVEKPIEEPKEHERIDVKKEKVIIRDPKHSSYSFINSLAKIIVNILKFILFIVAIFFVFTFILEAFGLTISIIYIKYNLLFVGTMIICIGVLTINYIILEIIYNCLVNAKMSIKRIFLTIIVGLLVIGIGSAITFYNASKITYNSKVQVNEDIYKEQTLDYEMEDNLVIQDLNNNYIIDNSIENIKVEIKYFKVDNVKINSYYDNKYSDNGIVTYKVMYVSNNFSFFNEYNLLLDELKENKIVDRGHFDDIKVTYHLSENNLKKLTKNSNRYYGL